MASTLRFDNWENSNGDLIGTAANGYLGVPGTVLQVVSNSITSSTTTTSTNVWANTGLSATITPSSTSSKVLVFSSGSLRHSNSAATSFVGIHRGDHTGTLLTSVSVYQNQSSSAIFIFGTTLEFLDSPNTNLPQEYSLNVLTNSSSNSAIYNPNSHKCSITLMEIAGG